MTDPVLVARSLTRTYPRGSETVNALRGVDLTLQPGEILCLTGRSGSGKSTLLQILGCLDRPTSGELWHGTVDVAKAGEAEWVRLRRERVGFVFQAFHLVEHLTALENVALPLKFRGFGAAVRQEKALQALLQVGLADRRQHRPSELSGGEAQRVCVARALVGSPGVILADEPTGELDSTTARELGDLFVRLNREVGQTFVIVTHDAALSRCATRLLCMQDGRIVPRPPTTEDLTAGE